MAKYYTSIRLEGHGQDAVEAALREAIGPSFEVWKNGHFMGVALQILDMTDAERQGREILGEPPLEKTPIVDVDLFSTLHPRPIDLQRELAGCMARHLEASLSTNVVILMDGE